MMRALAGLIVLLLIAAGAVYVVARREAVPIVRIEQPDKAIGQAGTLVVTADAPKAKFKALTVAVEQNGKSTPLFSLDSPELAKAAATSPRGAGSDHHHAAHRQAERPGASIGNGAHCRLGDASVVPEPAHAGGDRLERRSSQARAAGDRRALDPSLREPRRVRDGRVPRDAGRCVLGRAGRGCRVSGLSRVRRGRGRRRPVGSGRVFRAPLQPGSQNADRRLRARRSRATRRPRVSSTTSSRSRRSAAGSSSTIVSSGASCRKSSSTLLS